ncbi:hypothetical protein [Specibacter sp. RAF43]|uniref:hypothetical protein n=1 Tax=Specibacter sp. RAF43 TaxID=3233057 RepID=UPI003F99340B
MIAASLVEFVLLLRLVLGRAAFRRRMVAVAAVSFTVVVAGMLFGKYGLLLGLPWWIYYPLPALATILLPPLVFRMAWKGTAAYLVLAALSAPLIHAVFSFFLGWHEYMPFLRVPSLWEITAP